MNAGGSALPFAVPRGLRLLAGTHETGGRALRDGMVPALGCEIYGRI